MAARHVDPELAHLPSVAKIAAEIRCHPIEHVIANICRDLGITPEHALWPELDQALAAFGVSLSAMAEEPEPPQRRTAPQRPVPPPMPAPSAPPAAPLQTQPPAGTGPPAADGCSIAA